MTRWPCAWSNLPLSADMQLTPQASGGATLVATVDDNRALVGWLLSQAGSIRIHAPQALRVAMLEQLRQSLALHEEVVVDRQAKSLSRGPLFPKPGLRRIRS